MANLVIVESPSKAKTINKYLGKAYTVKASMGHIRDLPKKKLGVDVDENFAPDYETIPGKEKIIKEITDAAKTADTIYVATDPDREGEAIGYHIAGALGFGEGAKKAKSKQKIFRVMFNEITAKGIKEAFEHPGQINQDLVDSQQARRVLDRLVGYMISPLLWEKVRRGTSAGRVQTVAMRLIIEREREIRAFVSVEYWTIDVNVAAGMPPAFDAHLVKIDGKKPEIGNQEQADAIVEDLKRTSFAVEDVVAKEKKRNPVPPFITSNLQQDAARKLHFTVKKTMMLAQRLYEGVDIGEEGPVGLITYMRTDSTRVADDAIAACREHIASAFGENYLPAKPVFYKSKKGAQDAHEAIRPTNAARTPDSVKAQLDDDLYKLYKLIWQRFVASQMNPAIFDQTTIDITGGKFGLRATGSTMKFDGFLAVYAESKDEDIKDEESEELKLQLPPVKKGDSLHVNEIKPEQHFTQPPPRFNEATLVKTLEEQGIGRPSTYVAIINTIQEREYAVKQEGRFYPTELGFVINDVLVENFSDIFDVQYTARMEEELDEIEDGKIKWTDSMGAFYSKFKIDLAHAQTNMRNVKKQETPTDEICDKCGKPMVIKWGKHGSFLACSGYPDCKNTRELSKETAESTGTEINPNSGAPAVTEEEFCDICGKPMVLKRGRFGMFYACTGFPDCTGKKSLTSKGVIRVPPKPTGEICPECGGELVIRTSRNGEFIGCSKYPKCKYTRNIPTGIVCPKCGTGDIGQRSGGKSKRSFWGCSRYPDCDFISNAKPENKECPACHNNYVVHRYSKEKVEYLQCPKCEAEYTLEMAERT